MDVPRNCSTSSLDQNMGVSNEVGMMSAHQ